MSKVTVKQIKKELVRLDEDKLKEVLEFLTDEELEVEEEVVEVEEEVVEEEVDETPKQTYATIEDIQGLLKAFEEKFVPKEELEKVTKKAKPFGVKQSPEKPDNSKTKKSTQDYLNEINSRY